MSVSTFCRVRFCLMVLVGATLGGQSAFGDVQVSQDGTNLVVTLDNVPNVASVRLFSQYVRVDVNGDRHEIDIPNFLTGVQVRGGIDIDDITVTGVSSNRELSVRGGGGNDLITNATFAKVPIHGGPGNDILTGGFGEDKITGGADHDLIDGRGGVNLMLGMGGDDVITGGSSRDTIDGGPGRDTLYGGGSDDTIYGGPENDSIFGEGGRDYLAGDDGSDVISGGPGNDILYGGDESDVLYGDGGNDELHGNFDRVANPSRPLFDGYVDYLEGNAGCDTFDGLYYNYRAFMFFGRLFYAKNALEAEVILDEQNCDEVLEFEVPRYWVAF